MQKCAGQSASSQQQKIRQLIKRECFGASGHLSVLLCQITRLMQLRKSSVPKQTNTRICIHRNKTQPLRYESKLIICTNTHTVSCTKIQHASTNIITKRCCCPQRRNTSRRPQWWVHEFLMVLLPDSSTVTSFLHTNDSRISTGILASMNCNNTKNDNTISNGT